MPEPHDDRDALAAYATWIDDSFTPFDATAIRAVAASVAPPPGDDEHLTRAVTSLASRSPRRPVLAGVAAAIALALVIAGVVSTRRDTEQPSTVKVGEDPGTIAGAERPAHWDATATFEVPAGRNVSPSRAPVWTGTEVLLIGALIQLHNQDGTTRMGETLAYNPSTDAWRVIAAPPAELLGGAGYGGFFGESGRPSVAWTGTEAVMFVRPVGTAEMAAPPAAVVMALDPSTGVWRTITTVPPGKELSATRGYQDVVWTGSKLLVINEGFDPSILIVDPTTGERTEITQTTGMACTPNCWALPGYGTSAWNGHLMVMVGVHDEVPVAIAFDPTTSSFRSIAPPPGPIATLYRVGDDLMGRSGAGWVVWRAASDSWTALPPRPAPIADSYAVTIGTATRLITWGGSRLVHLSGLPDPPTTISPEPSGGATFDLATSSWQHIESSPDLPDWWLGGVWTGDRLFAWSGGVPEYQDIRTITGATWTPPSDPVSTGTAPAGAPATTSGTAVTVGTTRTELAPGTTTTRRSDETDPYEHPEPGSIGPGSIELWCSSKDGAMQVSTSAFGLAVHPTGVRIRVTDRVRELGSEDPMVFVSSAGEHELVPGGTTDVILPTMAPGVQWVGCRSAKVGEARNEVTILDEGRSWRALPTGCEPPRHDDHGAVSEARQAIDGVRWWGEHRPESFPLVIDGDRIGYAGYPEAWPRLLVHERGDAVLARYWGEEQPDGWTVYPAEGACAAGATSPAR